MPTFRKDPKLGTMVPVLKTADLNDKCVTTEKLADASVTEVKLAADIIERINDAIANANLAASHEERINTIEGDIVSILSDCANFVKTTTYYLKVMELTSSIGNLKSMLGEYCTLEKYTALKEQINTDVDALTKRVAALENK